MAPKDIPAAEVKRGTDLANRAVGSLLRRMTMPVYVESEGKIRDLRIYEVLEKAANKVDPSARVLASGGVFRSAWGKLYDLLYEEYRKNPNVDTAAVQQKIIDDNRDIPFTEVSGNGSDFDNLVRGKKEAEVSEALTDIVNSTRQHLQVQFGRDGETRAIFPLGDFKSYNEQTEEATGQGGSTTDFLAYDVRAGKLVDPPRFPGTVENLVRGIRSFAPPRAEVNVEDYAKDAVRGMRPATEISYLQLDPKSDALLKKYLRKALEEDAVSEKAIEQIEKLVRNSRNSGANNVVLRSDPNSVEGLFSQLVEKAGLTFPEFLPSYTIPNNPAESARRAKILSRSLISVEDFHAHTQDGILFHGTPATAHVMSMLRGNFIMSKETVANNTVGPKKLTGATYGTGLYVGITEDGAFHFDQGVKLRLKLKSGKPLNILDLSLASEDPAYQKIMLDAKSKGVDLNSLLARKYGIDVICDTRMGYAVILNSDAIQPLSISDLSEGMIASLASKTQDLTSMQESFSEIRNLMTMNAISGRENSGKNEIERSFLNVIGDPKRDYSARFATLSFLKSTVEPFLKNMGVERSTLKADQAQGDLMTDFGNYLKNPRIPPATRLEWLGLIKPLAPDLQPEISALAGPIFREVDKAVRESNSRVVSQILQNENSARTFLDEIASGKLASKPVLDDLIRRAKSQLSIGSEVYRTRSERIYTGFLTRLLDRSDVLSGNEIKSLGELLTTKGNPIEVFHQLSSGVQYRSPKLIAFARECLFDWGNSNLREGALPVFSNSALKDREIDREIVRGLVPGTASSDVIYSVLLARGSVDRNVREKALSDIEQRHVDTQEPFKATAREKILLQKIPLDRDIEKSLLDVAESGRAGKNAAIYVLSEAGVKSRRFQDILISALKEADPDSSEFDSLTAQLSRIPDLSPGIKSHNRALEFEKCVKTSVETGIN